MLWGHTSIQYARTSSNITSRIERFLLCFALVWFGTVWVSTTFSQMVGVLTGCIILFAGTQLGRGFDNETTRVAR